MKTLPTPVRYACDDLELVHTGDKLYAGEAAADAPTIPSQRGWRDGAGDHYVTFPSSTTDLEVVEYIVPGDRFRDAVERVYDTSRGTSRVDWRMKRQRMCRAEGGYTDAFTRFVSGASFGDIKSQMSLESESDASTLVHEALRQANKRYYRERH